MLVGSGLCINTYSEEEARTRQLVIAVGRHVVSGKCILLKDTLD